MVNRRTSYILVSLLLLCAVVAFAIYRYVHTGAAPEAASSTDAPFSVVDAANRELDGHPALALTFSQPLDTRGDYDQVIRVFKMPAPVKAKKSGSGDDDANNDGDTDSNGNPKAASEVSTSPALTQLEGGKQITGAWVVGDNPRLLFFPHIEPLSRYVVQVQDTLRAKDGRTLGHETRYSITTPAVTPAYYFASRGIVLPAKQNGGLPVVTVNVPEVDVQFLRVRADQLPRFFERVVASSKPAATDDQDATPPDDDADNDTSHADLQGAVNNWTLDSLHAMTESVYQGRFVTEQQTDKRSVTYLPVEDIKELKEPGIYVAVMSQPGRFGYEYQTTYFYVSDLGLHLRLFEHHADAFVSSLTDGDGVSGVELTWLDRQGKVLAHGTTDSDGHAAFAEQPTGAALVLAKKDDQMSMLTVREPALDLSEYEATGLPYKSVRLFAWSGRDLYRPGETFTVSVLARDADGRAVPPQPIQATLKRADGKVQFVANWLPDTKQPGYFSKVISLPADAPTGSWSLELRNDPADKLAGTVMRFGVEEFLPERMKLDLSSTATTLTPDQPFRVAVRGAYLYGAAAAGNRLLGVLTFQRNANPLATRYPGFEFGNANDSTFFNRQELDEQKLDAQGRTTLDLALDPAAGVHSPVTVRATLSLLESGGRPVIRTLERVIWPAPVLTGVRPLYSGDYAAEESPADFEVIRADSRGTLKGERAMPVRLFRENRNYYWRFDDQRGWNSGFTETDELVDTLSVDVPDGGRGKLRVPVKYGRYRLEILDPVTGQTMIYRFYAGWSAQGDETSGSRPDRVALKLDRDAYREGDTAHLTISPPHAGTALITVDGDRTLWTKRISVKGASQTIDIPVDPAWQRHDLYISVLVLRPGNQGDLVTPARALGLIALPLARSERKLDVTLEAPQKMKSETTVNVRIKVPNAKGEKALLTLSAVDVGILNITGFTAPDPFQFFFGRLRYGADLHDIYGRLIEKMAGKKGRLKWGGDTTPKATPNLPKKVQLVDIFNGPVVLDANGEAEVPIALPDFNGTLRLTAVVATGDRYGEKDQEMIVAAPVIAELSTPRYVTFGDRSTVALDVQNLTGAAQQFKVELGGDDGLQVSNGVRDLALKDQEKQTLRYTVDAGNKSGLHSLTVTVNGGPIAMTRHYALQVEAPTPPRNVVRRYTVEPGASLQVIDPAVGGLYPDSLSAHLLVSNQPPIDVRAAAKWLLEYPYGCAEQVASSAYPWLYIDEAAARQYGMKPYTRDQRAERIDFAVAKLGGYQSVRGGFSLWGNGPDDFWLSAYVVGFLQDARAQGFSVPDRMMQKALDYLLRGLQEGSAQVTPLPTHVTPAQMRGLIDDFARNNRNYEGLVQAGYVLARERKAPLSTLRQLFEQRTYANSGLPLVELGIALNLMGDQARSLTALQEGVRTDRVPGYWWWDYGSNLRDTALEYVLLDRDKITAPGSDLLVGKVANALAARNGDYYSTQERLALFRMGRALGDSSGQPWTAQLAGSAGTQTLSDKTTGFGELGVADFKQGVTLTNTSDKRLFVEVDMSGNPIAAPVAPTNAQNRIDLAREYLRADGTPLAGTPLKVGDTVLVHLSASSASVIGSALVVDRIPAGLEIENTNLVKEAGSVGLKVGDIDVADAMNSSQIEHVEFRDDRFAAAVKLGWGKLDLFYRARVVTPGQFVVPPLYAEDMYRPYVYGILSNGGQLSISDSDTASNASTASTTTAPLATGTAPASNASASPPAPASAAASAQ